MAKTHLNKLPEFCGDYLKSFMKLSSVHTYNTRSALFNNYYVPQISYCKTEQSLKVSGFKIWNNLPISLRNKFKTSSFNIIVKLLKQHFLEKENSC